MTSTRLPGKVLMRVKGRPLLSYQIERLRGARRIDELVIATTTNKDDDPIAALAAEEGLTVFRGSEHDVLDRYYQAAVACGAQHVMRLLADCPLADPVGLDRMIGIFCDQALDYLYTGESFAEGTDAEIFTFAALAESWRNARLRSEREHVSQYIRKHADRFSILVLQNETDDSKYRFSVDEPEDFEVVKAVLEHLYDSRRGLFGVDEIKTFLDGHPEILRLNAHVIRNEGLAKSLAQDAVVR
jgi:spore coat polysaccharide biosynthesis protein SpsF